MLKDEVAVPSNRYQTVEYASAVSDTDFENISDGSWSDVTASYGSIGDEVTITSSVTAGDWYAVHYDYPITTDEYSALTSMPSDDTGGGGAPMAGDEGGFFASFWNRAMTGISAILVALGLKRRSN